MRPGQGNRNRNRNNRNRHRSGSSGSGGGGNSSNKVFDSNGPDVKLRGTAQTVAEKYMQLGRDAQSSGDNVAAESYYQHAEHYYRIWAANQPQGASLIMSRKLGEEEFEEEGAAAEEGAEDEGPEGQAEAAAWRSLRRFRARRRWRPAAGRWPAAAISTTIAIINNRDNRNNGRERFRPRWQRNRERFPTAGWQSGIRRPMCHGAEPAAPAQRLQRATASGKHQASCSAQLRHQLRPLPWKPKQPVNRHAARASAAHARTSQHLLRTLRHRVSNP